MKIALYYPWLYLKSGVEKTILETVQRSRHQYTIFTNYYDEEGAYLEFKKYKITALKPIPVDRNILSVAKAAITILFQKIDLNRFDLLLIHSEGLGDLALLRKISIPAICFCHTPLRPVFDKYYKRLAMGKRNGFQKITYVFFAWIFMHLDRYVWSKYAYIFFNSRESLRRAQVGGLLEKNTRYSILHPGVNTKKSLTTPVYKKYFFLPGRIMWTKNIELAIQAFYQFMSKQKQFRHFSLIIAGQVDKKSRAYLETLTTMIKRCSGVQIIINPSSQQMETLYKNCYAVLAPAFNEDWGLTVIEGGSYAKPCIATRRGGYTESQIHGVTGLLVSSTSASFSRAMAVLATNPALTRRMGVQAKLHARLYTWGAFARVFDATVEKLNKKIIACAQ